MLCNKADLFSLSDNVLCVCVMLFSLVHCACAYCLSNTPCSPHEEPWLRYQL